jgi:hypothetical protein
MEIQTENKGNVIKLLSSIGQLLAIDDHIYNTVDPQRHKDDWGWFLNYQGVLDLVYYEMVDYSEEEVYSMFQASPYDKHEKPIAWYRDDDPHTEGYTEPREGCPRCFIPDAINDVILSKGVGPAEAREKYNLIEVMFKDLIRLRREYLTLKEEI